MVIIWDAGSDPPVGLGSPPGGDKMQLETAHPGDIDTYCTDLFFVSWFYHEDAGAGNCLLVY